MPSPDSSPMDCCKAGLPGTPSPVSPPDFPQAEHRPSARFLTDGVTRTLATVVAAAAAGWALDRLGVPVAWMVGPMAASVALKWTGQLQPAPSWAWRTAQAVIGASVASNLTRDVLLRLAAGWPAIVGVVAATLVVGAGFGLLLSRLTHLDQASALLGFVPGGASGMVAASADLGADPAAVALVQYLRLMLVLFSAPLLVFLAHLWEPSLTPAVPVDSPAGMATGVEAGLVTGVHAGVEAGTQAGAEAGYPPGQFLVAMSAPPAAGAPATAGDSFTGMVLALAIVGTGMMLGRYVPIAAGPLVFSMLLSAGAAWFGGLHPRMPAGLNLASLAVLGIYVGSRFDRATLIRARRVAAAATGLSLLLMVASVAIGWGLHVLTGLPLLTALLATAPGALETMTAMAVTTGAQAGPVLAVHALRLLLALLLGPVLTRVILGRSLQRSSQRS